MRNYLDFFAAGLLRRPFNRCRLPSHDRGCRHSWLELLLLSRRNLYVDQVLTDYITANYFYITRNPVWLSLCLVSKYRSMIAWVAIVGYDRHHLRIGAPALAYLMNYRQLCCWPSPAAIQSMQVMITGLWMPPLSTRNYLLIKNPQIMLQLIISIYPKTGVIKAARNV